MEIAVFVPILRQGAGQIYLCHPISVLLIAGAVKFLTVDPANLFGVILLPHLGHGTDQRMGIALLLGEQKAVPTESRVRG